MSPHSGDPASGSVEHWNIGTPARISFTALSEAYTSSTTNG
jgi:hypothetical protein